MNSVYLLTGRPGSGKTSLIKQFLAEITVKAGGFYTEEIRERGTRLGFRLVTLDGREALLADIGLKKAPRVGKYGVDVAAMDRVGVPALLAASRDDDIVVIDEIGKMELLSEEFRDAVMKIIGSGRRVLGTIMLQPHPFADAVKGLPGVKVVMLTREGYQQALEEVRWWLETITDTGTNSPGSPLSRDLAD